MQSMFEYRIRRLQRSALAKLALAAPRLAPLLKMPVPLARKEYSGDGTGKTLIVFLPGIDDVAEDFERRGFIDDLRRHGVAADAVALDAHYGYYAKRVIHERMADDVIHQARATGYERIWLAGVSLGGFGAASYAARYPSHVDGLLLFAPYLGGNALIREIAAAGGMATWEPGSVAEGDHQRALWAWFKRHFSHGKPGLPIYLGYGMKDRFAPANALLAAALPQGRVFPVPGGHDWKCWKRIWQLFLAAEVR
jgi:pimeloyl-ACP methyl ester carboxylesterase